MGKEGNGIIAISELEETTNKLIGFNSSKSKIMTPSSVYVSFERVENGFEGKRDVSFFHQILDSEAPSSLDEVNGSDRLKQLVIARLKTLPLDEVNGSDRPHEKGGVLMTQKGNLSHSGITFTDLIDRISGELPYKEELQSVIGSYGFGDKPLRQVGGTFQGGGNLTPEEISFSPGTYKDHVKHWYVLVFNSSPDLYQFNINEIVSNGTKETTLKSWKIQKDDSLDNFQRFLKEIFVEQGMEPCIVKTTLNEEDEMEPRTTCMKPCIVETTLGCGKTIVFTPNNNEPLKIPNELAFYTLLTETPYLDLVNEAMLLISSKPQCRIEGSVTIIYLDKGQFVKRKEIEVSPLIVDGKVNSENKAYGLLTSETTRKIIDGLNEFVKSVRGKYQINRGLGL